MGHCFVERLNVANFFRKLPSLLLIFLLAFNLSSLIQLCSCRSIESTAAINAATDSSSTATEASATASPLPPSPSTISSAVLRARNKNLGGSSIITEPKVVSPSPTSLKSGTGELLGHEKRFSNGHQIVAEALSESLSSVVSTSTQTPPPTVDNKVQSEVIASATPSPALPSEETVVVVVLTNNNGTSGQTENVDGEC